MMKDQPRWSTNRRRGPNPSSTFPAKLFKILSNQEFADIITWMPHGRSWRMLQPKVFSEVVSTKYFSHQSKYASFMRQVNGWGFKRITRGPDRNSYYHELFVRDNPELAWTMSRRGSSSSKNSGGKDEADKEPNFYEMTRLANTTASTGSGANNSLRIPSQLHPLSAAGAGSYDNHDGQGHLYDSNYNLTHGGTISHHRYVPSQPLGAEPQHYDMHGNLYNRNYDLTHGGTIDPRQQVLPRSLGAEPQYSFHPYGGGESSNQATVGNFPTYPPTYYDASRERPAPNYPSAALDYQQGLYTHYGPPPPHSIMEC